MAEMTFVDALNQAIKEEMRQDEKVFIMGESIRGLGCLTPKPRTR